ncbi:hypothetical protein [Actinopolymorpha sp. B9G3]|uniref:hypothetical protein n=1 Tax=Actinopolymorpha sp. B9G3 TaxID=3158970 RepID=UPI0032D8DB74
MEILVLCFVVAAMVQHAAKDAFAGVTGRTFPSQAYRMKRLELRATRAGGSGQTPARRSPAREYFAGLWALAWDTQSRRLDQWSQERQERWERKRAGEVVEAGKPRPAREFARVWWHTGPSQQWANAWQRAADRRRRKLDAADEPADRQPVDEPPALPEGASDPKPAKPVGQATSSEKEAPKTEEEPEPPSEPEKEPADDDRTRGGVNDTDATTDGTNEGIDEMTTTTMGGPSLATGEAPGLDAKQAFVQSYATVFPAIKLAFLNYATTLAADEYGPATQAAAVQAAEAVEAAELAVARLAEVVCGAAADIRDRAAASGFEVGRDALKQ